MAAFELGELADLVLCPQSQTPLGASEDRLVCADEACRLSFPVRDEIPILLVDEATRLDESDWRDLVSGNGETE